MKRILSTILLFTSAKLAMATHLQQQVDTIINRVDPNINMGIVVVDLNTGENLYQRNANRPFIPASNMKLFSDAAALLALGPDYRFKTQLTTDASSLEQGVLKGSIYLHFPGDPSFTQDDLKSLLAPLATMGVKQIQGNIILASHNAVVNPYSPGRAPSDYKYSYGAPVAPIALNENRLTITVNPGYRVGQPAFIELSDPNASQFLDNQVKTAASSTRCGVSFNMDNNNRLTIRGCVHTGQWAVQQRIAILNPLRYAQDSIKAQLTHNNIKLNGQISLGRAPSTSLLLSSHLSKPIYQIMADTLKPSDNLYADSLYLHTAAKLHGSPVNWDQAQFAIKNFLEQQTGIPLQNAALVDGSGLSRNNLLSAQQTIDLLRFLHTRFPVSYEYISALPVAGYDGTLQKRFRRPFEQGLLRAKTGTMTGVMSLSGYLYTANAHTLAFAIFINKSPKTRPEVSGRYRSLVDTLCDFFLQQRPDNRFYVQIQKPYARVAYQQQPTYAERQRTKFAKWRQLESAIKQALQGQPITVLFRNNQLVLKDQGADLNKVWSALQALSKRFLFTVALNSKTSPGSRQSNPLMLWIKTDNQESASHRTWTIHESIS